MSEELYDYDDRNRMIQVKSNASTVTADYAYDAAGNMTGMKTYKGSDTLSTTYTYDARNRLLTMKDPLGNTESYTYDNNNNQLTKKDRKNVTTTTTYDQHSRPIKVSGGGIYTDYTYTKTGQPLTLSNTAQTITYTYDAAGRLTTESETETGGITKHYAYDADHHRTSMVVKQGITIRQTDVYTYDSAGRLALVKDGTTDANKEIAKYEYDANGNRSKLTRSGGIVTNYTYNKANLVTSVSHNRPSYGTYLTHQYEYYLSGNISKKIESNGWTTTYEYDDKGQLLKDAAEKRNSVGTLLDSLLCATC